MSLKQLIYNVDKTTIFLKNTMHLLPDSSEISFKKFNVRFYDEILNFIKNINE